MNNRNAVSLLLSAGLLTGEPLMAAVPSASLLGNTCAGCHGTDGASRGEAPTIAGLSKEYLVATMTHYKTDQMHSTVMGRLAKGYDTAEIEAMAGFFAGKPWVSGKQDIDPGMVAKGEALHKSKGCTGCHGERGETSTATTPRLAGQYAQYMAIQMGYYQDPKHAIPPSALPMRTMLTGLSENELHALAAYYASQK
jgi:sulfide dehydrogenase cytochrome subunit